jgi:hypothetical protein
MFCCTETRDFLHTYHVGGPVDDHEVLILIFNIQWDIFKALHQLVAIEKVGNQLDPLLSPHMKPSSSNKEIASQYTPKLVAHPLGVMPRILIFTYIIYFQTFVCLHSITK